MSGPEPVVALVTAPETNARTLARLLVERRLAACVNVLPAVDSYYYWEGSMQTDSESLLVIKTTRDLVEEIEALLRDVHPYTMFELVVLPVIGGSRAYIDWLIGEVHPDQPLAHD